MKGWRGGTTVEVQRRGEDLVIGLCSVPTTYDKVLMISWSTILAGGALASVVGLLWLPAPQLVVGGMMMVAFGLRFWPELRWWISGIEEWRLTGTTLVYQLWYGEHLKLRREWDLGQIDHLGARLGKWQSTEKEFAVVIGDKDRLVGRGALSREVAASINEALREYLARPGGIQRAKVFD